MNKRNPDEFRTKGLRNLVEESWRYSRTSWK